MEKLRKKKSLKQTSNFISAVDLQICDNFEIIFYHNIDT